MKLKRVFLRTAVAMALAAVGCQTQRPTIAPSPTTEGDDIVGIVAGPKGPEAGVWVIAETNELPTKYTKIVVTDEHGRFAIPDLPWVRYSVWVRGYGLADSPQGASGAGEHALPALGARGGRQRGGGDLSVDEHDQAGACQSCHLGPTEHERYSAHEQDEAPQVFCVQPW
jgi:hypothetical protein